MQSRKKDDTRMIRTLTYNSQTNRNLYTDTLGRHRHCTESEDAYLSSIFLNTTVKLQDLSWFKTGFVSRQVLHLLPAATKPALYRP